MGLRRSHLAILIVLLAGTALSATASGLAPIGDRTVDLAVRHSRFSQSHLEVKRGQTLRFVVKNSDPIDHELIVGSRQVQDRHETGTEAHHAARDGEISVPLFQTAETSYTFNERGTFFFGCHLPGHWDYGMKGTITVR
jgi:uncharacterized cupredoxin-like copper-binding protein